MFNARRVLMSLCAFGFASLCLAGASAPAAFAQSDRLQVTDYQRLRSAGDADFSPDGHLLAYSITRYDRPGRPWGQLCVIDIATGKSTRIGGENEASGGAVWSHDGKWIAYMGAAEGKHGLVIAHPDGSPLHFSPEVSGTNAPALHPARELPGHPTANRSRSSPPRPVPETADASGDPMVITRYHI